MKDLQIKTQSGRVVGLVSNGEKWELYLTTQIGKVGHVVLNREEAVSVRNFISAVLYGETTATDAGVGKKRKGRPRRQKIDDRAAEKQEQPTVICDKCSREFSRGKRLAILSYRDHKFCSVECMIRYKRGVPL